MALSSSEAKTLNRLIADVGRLRNKIDQMSGHGVSNSKNAIGIPSQKASAQKTPQPFDGTLLLYNNDNTAFEPLQVINSTLLTVTPATDLEGFKQRVTLRGGALVNSTMASTSTVVCAQRIPAKSAGRVYVNGIFPVKINVVDSNHGYAEQIDTSGELTSCLMGRFRIVYQESGTGTGKYCVVQFPVMLLHSLQSPVQLAHSTSASALTDTWTLDVNSGSLQLTFVSRVVTDGAGGAYVFRRIMEVTTGGQIRSVSAESLNNI